MPLKANKGEWSELYTLLKLLADGKIFAADKDLNKNENLFYVILKILRDADLEYVRNNRIVIQRTSGEILSEIPITTIVEYANLFYKGIEKGGEERAFDLESSDKILEQLHTNSISDERKETADIRVIIHDPITQHEPLLGFSIKSYIGGKPTLFNANKKSNLLYKITPDLNNKQISELNSLDSYGVRIKWLVTNGHKIEFVKVPNEIFKTNLELIDSRLAEIIANILIYKYIDKISSLPELAKKLTQINPCDFNIKLNPNFYSYKIKRLLVDSALGMKAGKLWTGTFNATGGYIAVKKGGELLCFHIYNWNDFQEYLFNHTKIDSPDSGADRCDYGTILDASEVGEENGTFIKLNFQIRFV